VNWRQDAAITGTLGSVPIRSGSHAGFQPRGVILSKIPAALLWPTDRIKAKSATIWVAFKLIKAKIKPKLK
jgi:hypothetical protein